jgi:hypothetical protein
MLNKRVGRNWFEDYLPVNVINCKIKINQVVGYF